MAMRYWACRPKNQPEHIRIERAETAVDAMGMAFGRPIVGPWNWEAKDLGTRVRVIQSDRQRIALLRDPAGWQALGKEPQWKRSNS